MAGEPVEQPRRQPEQPDLLGGGRLGGEVVGVVGVAAGGLDLVGVAVAPHAALAEQPVGGAPGGEQQQRRPPGEAEQHEGGGDAPEEHDETLGDEVHVHEHRRTGLSEVEVAGGREVVGEVAALEVADPVGTEGGPHQPVVEDAAEPVAGQGADDLVDRRRDLRDHEEDREHRERNGQVGTGLEAADQESGRDGQPRRHQGADDEQQPPHRREPGTDRVRLTKNSEAGRSPSRDRQPDPRDKGCHGVTLGDPADTPSNPLPPPGVLEA